VSSPAAIPPIATGGTCERHGKVEACYWHSEYHLGHSYQCPVCAREEEQQHGADQAEADRRNRQHPDPRPGYIADYRREGYGQAAAEALANKRHREDPQPKYWTAGDIAGERHTAERQRKIEARVIAFCPHCRRDAPASDGIILKHTSTVVEPSGADGPKHAVDCPGEGTAAG
jgi:hypothetical protein